MAKRWVCSCMEDDAEDCGDDQSLPTPCDCRCHGDDWEVEE